MADALHDDRVAAYIGARERLAAAEKLKTSAEGELICGLANPLPPLYWSLLTEAQILADLAGVDAQVGIAAGGYFEQQQRRITRARAQAEMDRHFNARAGRR